MINVTVLAPFDSNHDYSQAVSRAATCLNQCQNQFRFYVRRWRTEESETELTRAEGEEYAQSLRGELHLPADRFLVAVVLSPLEGNWFSFVNHPAKCAFVTFGGWFLFSHFPVESFLAIEFVQNLQEHLLNWTDYSYAHARPRGCLNDLCEFKRDISLKIQSGYVCPECQAKWQQGFNNRQIEALLSALDRIREMALGRVPVEKPLVEEMVFPVAVIYRQLQAESEATRRFSYLLDLFDIAVRFSVFTLLADLVYHSEGTDGQAVPSRRDFVKDRPTLGDWVDALPKLLDHFQKEPGSSSFGEEALSDVRTAGKLIRQRRLVRLRNDTKGHAYTFPPDHYERLFEKHWQDVDNVIRKLTGILTTKLVTVTKADFKRRARAYDVSGRLLVGSNAIFKPYGFVSSGPLERNEVVFLCSNTEQPVPLLGLVRWSTCPECAHERVLVSDDRDEYLDPMVGHRVKLDT